MRGHDLMASSFDPDTLAAGEPVIVATDVVSVISEGFGEYAVSDTGTLVYMEAAPGGRWLHRLRPGRGPEVLNSRPLSADYGEFRLSPSGDRVVYYGEAGDLWVYDLVRNVVERLTQTPEFEYSPVWHPDGEHVVFAAGGEGGRQFRQIDVGTRAVVELLEPDRAQAWPGAISPDGTILAFGVQGDATGQDVMLLRLGETAESIPFLVTPATESACQQLGNC